jgi:hypothetical protein
MVVMKEMLNGDEVMYREMIPIMVMMMMMMILMMVMERYFLQ